MSLSFLDSVYEYSQVVQPSTTKDWRLWSRLSKYKVEYCDSTNLPIPCHIIRRFLLLKVLDLLVMAVLPASPIVSRQFATVALLCTNSHVSHKHGTGTGVDIPESMSYISSNMKYPPMYVTHSLSWSRASPHHRTWVHGPKRPATGMVSSSRYSSKGFLRNY